MWGTLIGSLKSSETMDDRARQRLLDVAKATIQAASTVAAACVVASAIRDGAGVHAGRHTAYLVTRCVRALLSLPHSCAGVLQLVNCIPSVLDSLPVCVIHLRSSRYLALHVTC